MGSRSRSNSVARAAVPTHHGLVIDGKTAVVALKHCRSELRALASECTAVLGCRLAPIQKVGGVM
jgi:hypothetical protein